MNSGGMHDGLGVVQGANHITGNDDRMWGQRSIFGSEHKHIVDEVGLQRVAAAVIETNVILN